MAFYIHTYINIYTYVYIHTQIYIFQVPMEVRSELPHGDSGNGTRVLCKSLSTFPACSYTILTIPIIVMLVTSVTGLLARKGMEGNRLNC